MIITDYNEMSIEELAVISSTLGVEYTIADGQIVSAERKNYAGEN